MGVKSFIFKQNPGLKMQILVVSYSALTCDSKNQTLKNPAMCPNTCYFISSLKISRFAVLQIIMARNRGHIFYLAFWGTVLSVDLLKEYAWPMRTERTRAGNILVGLLKWNPSCRTYYFRVMVSCILIGKLFDGIRKRTLPMGGKVFRQMCRCAFQIHIRESKPELKLWGDLGFYLCRMIR